ncbi:MAG: hypothetical protein EOO15_00260 [Chitinophagaceae bacterium]|nr:MAG: hypothetical protein EOO15_00260 [Chitinophagaceae bacterium]
MTTFRSKVGLELIVPISVIVGGTGTLMIYQHIWAGLIFILLATIFIVHMIVTTCYIIDDETLIIKSGVFFKKSISINSIREIKATKNPISSPAASLDRLIITYNIHDNVIISPKEKNRLINSLLNINPSINVSSRS